MRLLTIIHILFSFSVVTAERRVRGRKHVQRKLEQYTPLQNGVPVVSIQHNIDIFDKSAFDKIESDGDSPIDPVDSDTNDEENNHNEEEKDNDYASSGDKEVGAASRKLSGKKGGKKASYKSTMVESGKKGSNGKKGEKSGKKGKKSDKIDNTRSNPMTPAPNSQEPTSAPVSSPADFSFVEFGSYTQLPRNEGCGDFFSFSAIDALQGNSLELLSNGAAERFLLEFNSTSPKLVWYGFGVDSIYVYRDGLVGFGPDDIYGYVSVASNFWDYVSFNPGADDSARVYYDEAEDHRIISWENMPVFGYQNIIMNFQVLFFYNGDIEIKWGIASGIDNGPIEVYSELYHNSYFLNNFTLAEGSPYGGTSAWPTNQCSRFNLVKPE